MSDNYITAQTAMREHLRAYWEAHARVGDPPEVPALLFHGLEVRKEPKPTDYWARFSTTFSSAVQSSLRNGEVKRYTPRGVLFVQVFAPKRAREAMTAGAALAMVAQAAFRRKAGGVWFRNVRIMDLEPDSNSYRWNVAAEFEYSELA